MVTLMLGQTLVFWSGVLAGLSFVLLMLTCSVNLGCADGVCSGRTRKKLFALHKYFVWASIIATGIHAILALLSSVFHIWL